MWVNSPLLNDLQTWFALNPLCDKFRLKPTVSPFPTLDIFKVSLVKKNPSQALISLDNETVWEERETWAEEGTVYVTYPGCTGTQSSVHISWLLPQDSQIISSPWHGASSTALGCLTEHDIASVCVGECVLQRGPNLNPSAPPADCEPSGPAAIKVSCRTLLTCCMIL